MALLGIPQNSCEFMNSENYYEFLGTPNDFLCIPRTSQDLLGPQFPGRILAKSLVTLVKVLGNPSNSQEFQGANRRRFPASEGGDSGARDLLGEAGELNRETPGARR